MKRKRSILLPVLAVLLLAAIGCKKKQSEGDQAPKTTEGSGSGSAAAGSATGSAPGSAAEPAAGSAAVADPAAGSAATPDTAKQAGTKTILETATAAGTFGTLLKAITAAGLADRLNGAGPFTVFAPTDEAFAKIPAKDLEALLADKTKLEALLQRHVVTGAVSSKDLAAQKAIKSLQGDELAVDAASGVKIGGATVVTADIPASNGVIHAIDTVLLPK